MAVHPQHRAHPAVGRGRRDIDAQVELAGETADRGQAHARRITQVGEEDGGVTGHQPLGAVAFVTGHAEARVVHGDAHPVVDVLQAHHDVGVGRGVPQRVVEEFGDDDGDGFHRVRDQGSAGFQMVVHLDALIAREPGLAAGDRVHQVRLLAREPHPGPAHHGGDLGAPQRLLVLVVELEQGLRQLGVVVALLQSSQGVLEPVEGRLDLPRGAAHAGLCGRVDAGALGGHLRLECQKHVLQGDAERGADRQGLEGTGHGQVWMGHPLGGGGHPPCREMLDLGGERP